MSVLMSVKTRAETHGINMGNNANVANAFSPRIVGKLLPMQVPDGWIVQQDVLSARKATTFRS